jgi:hypothetical protein
MEYQVVFLDSYDVYQVIFSSTDYYLAYNFYQDQLNNNFTGTYTQTPSIYTKNYLFNQTYVVSMTDTQIINISFICSGCSQYCMIFSM